jgi:hypothetical protein
MIAASHAKKPRMKVGDIARVPPDRLLAEELSADILVEMANLTSAQTGVSGTIFVSTAMGQHGPRVKYYVRPGRTQPSLSVSISDAPALVANSLPAHVANQSTPQVVDWVLLNKDALLDFWYHGDTWTQSQVNAFVQTLKPI